MDEVYGSLIVDDKGTLKGAGFVGDDPYSRSFAGVRGGTVSVSNPDLRSLRTCAGTFVWFYRKV